MINTDIRASNPHPSNPAPHEGEFITRISRSESKPKEREEEEGEEIDDQNPMGVH